MSYDLKTANGLKSAKRYIAQHSDQYLAQWAKRYEPSLYSWRDPNDPWLLLIKQEINKRAKKVEKDAKYAANRLKWKQKKRKSGTYNSKR